mgnify:FL=1
MYFSTRGRSFVRAAVLEIMAHIVLPDNCEDLDDLRAHYWYHEEGDPVEAGAYLVEIVSPSGAFSLESPIDGVLEEVFVQAGESFDADDIIAVVNP